MLSRHINIVYLTQYYLSTYYSIYLFIYLTQYYYYKKCRPTADHALKTYYYCYYYLQDHSTEVLHYDQFMSQRVNW